MCVNISRFRLGGLTCEKPRRKSEGILSHGSLARYFLGGIQMGKTMELTALMGTIQKILIWTVRLIRVSWEFLCISLGVHQP